VWTGLDENGPFVVLGETVLDLAPKGLKFVVGPDDGNWQEKSAARFGFEFPTDLDPRTSNKPDMLALFFPDDDGNVASSGFNGRWLPRVFGPAA
jgi:hypothetical protein